MKENILEIVVGSVVIILALSFVFFTVSSTGIQKKGKYINAEFGHIGGLKVRRAEVHACRGHKARRDAIANTPIVVQAAGYEGFKLSRELRK